MIQAFVSYVLTCDVCRMTSTAEKADASQLMEASKDRFIQVEADGSVFFICIPCLALHESISAATFAAKKMNREQPYVEQRCEVVAHAIHG